MTRSTQRRSVSTKPRGAEEGAPTAVVLYPQSSSKSVCVLVQRRAASRRQTQTEESKAICRTQQREGSLCFFGSVTWTIRSSSKALAAAVSLVGHDRREGTKKGKKGKNEKQPPKREGKKSSGN